MHVLLAIALQFGKLIDGQGHVTNNPVVIVNGDRIERIASTVPDGAEVVDLRKYTAVPGLVDVHTHMSLYWDRTPGTRPWTQLGSLGPAVTVFLAQENARKSLEAGVTTVRDLGGWEYTDVAIRDLINRGAMIGPRMFVAAHGLHISGKPERGPDPGACDGADACARATRQQLAMGADVVKMYGSTGSDQDVTGFQTF